MGYCTNCFKNCSALSLIFLYVRISLHVCTDLCFVIIPYIVVIAHFLQTRVKLVERELKSDTVFNSVMSPNVDIGPKKPLRCYIFFDNQVELCSKMWAFFFTFNNKNVKHLRGNRTFADHFTPYRHFKVCYIMSSCFIYSQPFRRLFVSFHVPSPYHAVIIRLATKQYYFFVHFLEFSQRLASYFNHIYSKNLLDPEKS